MLRHWSFLHVFELRRSFLKTVYTSQFLSRMACLLMELTRINIYKSQYLAKIIFSKLQNNKKIRFLDNTFSRLKNELIPSVNILFVNNFLLPSHNVIVMPSHKCQAHLGQRTQSQYVFSQMIIRFFYFKKVKISILTSNLVEIHRVRHVIFVYFRLFLHLPQLLSVIIKTNDPFQSID